MRRSHRGAIPILSLIQLIALQNAAHAGCDDVRVEITRTEEGTFVDEMRTRQLVLDCIESAGQIRRDQIDALADVDRRLGEARSLAASLREAEALRLLGALEADLRGLASVAGVAAWIAEVQITVGLVAAQAGLNALAEQALARAAALDPQRALLAAEASPEIVAYGQRMAADVRSRPVGEFEVVSSTSGAEVYLDDRLLGPVPQKVRVSVGTHVIRVQAPGYQPYGQMLQVFEGQRSPVSIDLSPDPAMRAVASLHEAARVNNFARVVRALTELENELPLEVSLRFVHTAPARFTKSGSPRQLMVLCRSQGCVGPFSESDGTTPEDKFVRGTTVSKRYDERLAWLLEDLTEVPLPPWYERWDVWFAAGTVLALSAVIVGLGMAPEPEQEREVVFEIPDSFR